METTDWLIKGISEKQLQKEKEEARRHISRKEKQEKKKSMREYRKMHRRHRKELVKLAKEVRPFDWGWLDELVHAQIKHMYEYFSAGNNVWQTDETRLPIVEQLKHVMDLYEELDNIWDRDTKGEDGFDSVDKIKAQYQREEDLYREIYSYVGCHLKEWWD